MEEIFEVVYQQTPLVIFMGTAIYFLIKKLVKVDLTQGEFNALVSFTYNVGSGNLESSTLLKLINEERYIAASEQFLRWTKASGKQLKGLLIRRQEEKQVFLRNNPGDPK